jgi:gliding motility-associated-like protein
MRKQLTFLLAFCLFAIGFSNKAFATHSAGGELIYNLVPGTTNQYKFIFKFYRNCTNPGGGAASNEPQTFDLCYTSPCGVGGPQTVIMPKIAGNIATSPASPNGSILTNGCDNNNTSCSIPNSTIPGYEQWWYEATITLPLPCNAWRFWVPFCCRNNSIQNLGAAPGSANIYVETTLDNSISITIPNPTNLNNSARFLNSNSASSLPIPYVCVNTLFIHNGGATDPDTDSLSFETISPRDGACGIGAPIDLLNTSIYNTLNTNGNPLACNNTYNLNTQTGEFSFIPSQVGAWVVSHRIREWRKDANGIAYLVGTVVRDMQIIVDNCLPLPVTPDVDSLVVGGNNSNDTIYACPNTLLNYCFTIKGHPGTYVIHTNDNSASALLGSNIVYSHPLNPITNAPIDSVLRGCVTWTPSISDTGFHNLVVSVRDTFNCLTNPAVISFPVKVRRNILAWGDTTICANDTVNIYSFANGSYSWTTLPGGSGNSSIINLTIPNPPNVKVHPNLTTFYVAKDLVCLSEDTVEVIVKQGPALTMSPDTTTCVNSFMPIGVTPNPPGSYTYSWLPTTGLDNPNLQYPTLINPTSTTVFKVTVTPNSQQVCISTDSVKIKVLKGYKIANNDTIICKGGSLNIVATGGDADYTYQWSPTQYVSDPNSLIPVSITPPVPGSFNYTFTASFTGCPDSVKTLKVDVQPLPKVNAGIDRQICNGDTAHLEGSATPLGLTYTYSWTPGGDLNDATLINPIFSGDTNVIIKLFAQTSAGCKDSDAILISVASSSFLKAIGDTSICPNETAVLKSNGALLYNWSPGIFVDDSTLANTFANPIATTNFRVVGFSSYGCTDTAMVTIVVQPEAQLELGDNRTIYPSEKAEIFGQTNCSEFAWFPSYGLNTTNQSGVIATPAVTTRYVVNAKTEKGCTTSDSIDVIVVQESVVEVPNAFSPGSGTSTNDELRVIVKGKALLNSFKVFNRWGQLVFTTTDITKGWNGQLNGKPQPLGAYVYAVEATTSTGKRVNKQGNVTLLR